MCIVVLGMARICAFIALCEPLCGPAWKSARAADIEAICSTSMFSVDDVEAMVCTLLHPSRPPRPPKLPRSEVFLAESAQRSPRRQLILLSQKTFFGSKYPKKDLI